MNRTDMKKKQMHTDRQAKRCILINSSNVIADVKRDITLDVEKFQGINQRNRRTVLLL